MIYIIVYLVIQTQQLTYPSLRFNQNQSLLYENMPYFWQYVIPPGSPSTIYFQIQWSSNQAELNENNGNLQYIMPAFLVCNNIENTPEQATFESILSLSEAKICFADFQGIATLQSQLITISNIYSFNTLYLAAYILQSSYFTSIQISVTQVDSEYCQFECSESGECVSNTCKCFTFKTGSYCQYQIFNLSIMTGSKTYMPGWSLIKQDQQQINFNVQITSNISISVFTNYNNLSYPTFANRNIVSNKSFLLPFINSNQNYSFIYAIYSSQIVQIKTEIAGTSAQGSSSLSAVLIAIIVIVSAQIILCIFYSIYSIYDKRRQRRQQLLNEELARSPQMRDINILNLIRERLNRNRQFQQDENFFLIINQYLPSLTFYEIQNSYNISQGYNSNQKFSCMVCLIELKDEDLCRLTYCLHIFHQECIDEWLKKHNTCPLCRETIDKDHLEKGKDDFDVKKVKKVVLINDSKTIQQSVREYEQLQLQQQYYELEEDQTQKKQQINSYFQENDLVPFDTYQQQYQQFQNNIEFRLHTDSDAFNQVGVLNTEESENVWQQSKTRIRTQVDDEQGIEMAMNRIKTMPDQLPCINEEDEYDFNKSKLQNRFQIRRLY